MRAPIVPAPRIATLLMRFMIEPQLITRTTRCSPVSSVFMIFCGQSAIGNRLWQFIHRPVIVASVHHNNAGKAPADAGAFRSLGNQDDRKLIAPALQRLASLDLVSGGRGLGEKSFDDIRSNRFLGMAAEQRGPAFDIARLPCLKKVIRCGECRDVAWVWSALGCGRDGRRGR